jgi:hypothetical protein
MIGSLPMGAMMPVTPQTGDDVACRVYNGGMALGTTNATLKGELCMAANKQGGCGDNSTTPSMPPTMTSAAPVLAASVVFAVLPLFV